MEDQADLIDDYPEDGVRTEKEGWFPYIPRRYILTVLIFLGTANSYALRVNFNVALVAMVNYTASDDVNNTLDQCPGPSNLNNKTQSTGDFNWSPMLQSLLLGSYYYGYPVAQPLGGYLADRFGAKWLIASTGITAGILNLLQPTVASWNPYALVVLRALLGLVQGPLWPSLTAMLANWTPDKERARLFAICNGGSLLGTVLSQTISGILCDLDFLGGWPAAFYVFGVLSLIWSGIFIMFTTNSPATHPSVSEEERKLIEGNVGDITYKSPPWKSIFTSRPFLVFMFVLFMDVTAYDIIFTFLPLYMKRVLKYDISQSGGLASVPYITSFLISFLAGYSSDIIRNKGWLSTMWIRRIYTAGGELTPALMVLIISLLGCDRVAVVLCFIIFVSATGMSNGGFNVNMYDLAPRYAGALYGISNAVANVGGFTGPLIVGALTGNSGDLDSWRTVFYLVAGLFTLGCSVFCIFGSADLQPWADFRQEISQGNSIQKRERAQDEKDRHFPSALNIT